jgi:hypothetical protein
MRGRYQYFNGGQPAPVEETFSDDGSGSLLAVRSASPYHIQVSAAAHTCDLVFHSPEGRVSLHTVCDAHGLEVTRRHINAEKRWQLSASAVFFPLMRVFTGRVIRQIAAQGGQAQVIVPDIRRPQDTETLLVPMSEARRVQWLGDERIAAWPDTPCDVFSYVGGAYDASARFYLAGDLLVRYTFDDWEAVLVDYTP